MDKYEILKNKLNNIIMHIDYMLENVEFQYESSKEYLLKYKEFVEYRIEEVNNRTIPKSRGVKVLGLIRGLSDHDELCNNDKLWKMVGDADIYYKNECKKF